MLKPLLFQCSLRSFIAHSIAQSAAPIKVPPGSDRHPGPLSYATDTSRITLLTLISLIKIWC